MDVRVREANKADLGEINAIYNHYVLNSTCTYQMEPATAEERVQWFHAHGPKHPVTVAELEGRVVGWGSLSRFHARAAYQQTVENSVYVHHEWHRRGVGRHLLRDLIRRAAEADHHTIIAGISADQEASIRLHHACGFVSVAHLREVGYKFNRWLDVVYMQLMV